MCAHDWTGSGSLACGIEVQGYTSHSSLRHYKGSATGHKHVGGNVGIGDSDYGGQCNEHKHTHVHTHTHTDKHIFITLTLRYKVVIMLTM